ncbi:MAG: DUF2156 domain-containing protein [Desulfobacterales bacterium]|nr:MAG: DUF2156 domain-containing protein [Desulfobacterales bacterium]UCD90185.1 MAG: DUF2156 domain-containing protein [Desulfobacterales bacterium]
MPLNFEPIRLNKQIEYLKYFAQCSQKASDYSFVNLWGWAEEYGLYWAWQDGLVWIKQTIPETVYWAPVGQWQETFWDRWLHDYFTSPAVFTRIPEDLALIWKEQLGKRIIIEEVRDHWDYLYHVYELVSLRGNRFHKKKNLLNQFLKKYRFEFIPLRIDMINKAMAMQADWCTWRDCESSESLSAENRAIARILNSWENLQTVSGGAIMVEQDLAAYTIAESLSEDTIVIHFEKGNQQYKGVYQAINQIFLEQSAHQHRIVNREQDLGNEGLRNAKISYNPFDFVKKYQIVMK